MVPEQRSGVFGEKSAPAGADELVLTAAAGPLRRALGPTSWVVLEELTATGSPGAAGTLVVVTSVRALAESLGLGRDAVAGALQALGLGGWVRWVPARDDGGRFGAGRYVVSGNPALRRAGASAASRASRPKGSSATKSRPRPSSSTPAKPETTTTASEQLSLLDLSQATPPPDATATTAP